MFSITEQFSAATKTQLETQLKIINALASKAVESAEKVIALNISTTKATVETSSAAAKKLLEAKDPQELFKLGNSQPPSFDKLIAYTRELYSIASSAQEALLQSAQEQIKDVPALAAAIPAFKSVASSVASSVVTSVATSVAKSPAAPAAASVATPAAKVAATPVAKTAATPAEVPAATVAATIKPVASKPVAAKPANAPVATLAPTPSAAVLEVALAHAPAAAPVVLASSEVKVEVQPVPKVEEPKGASKVEANAKPAAKAVAPFPAVPSKTPVAAAVSKPVELKSVPAKGTADKAAPAKQLSILSAGGKSKK